MSRLAVVAGGRRRAEDSGGQARSRRFRASLHEDGTSILFLVSDDRCGISGARSGEWRRCAAAAARSGGDQRARAGQGRPPGGSGANDKMSGEIHALENSELRVLTHHNDALLAELKLGATEEFSCKAKDGNEVHGLIVEAGRTMWPGKKYPTLLRIHGGPNGQDAHCVQLRTAVLRRQRLRGGGGELSRQFGARREIPGRDLGRLGQ